MQEIASAAGLSVGFVSQVERGIAVPSISSLRKLAAALEQPVGNFLEVSSQNSQLTRSSERLPFTLGQNALTYERLSHSFGGSKLTALLIHEPPGHRTEPVSHEGEELFFVIKGELTVEVDEERVILRTGDHTTFSTRTLHLEPPHRGGDPAVVRHHGCLRVERNRIPHQIPEKMARSSRVSPLSHVRMSTNLQEEKT